jgi:hypothetical protein
VIVDSPRHIRRGTRTTAARRRCLPADRPRSPRWVSIATPRASVSKRPSPDNPAADLLIAQLYEDLVEVEALAVTADEAVTQLPSRPRGKYGRTLPRLYTLVGKTSGRAQGALERGEELVALPAAQLVAQVPKRSPARRAR